MRRERDESLPAVRLPAGGVVLGVGIDLIETSRIARALERHRERFLSTIFTDAERDYCERMKNPYPHYAARFAAKEAVSKAFSTGIGGYLKWRSIGVVHGERNAPHVALDELGEKLLQEVGGDGILISLSHTENYGQAVAMIVRRMPS